MGIFSNLFRGEMLEKTLHYYYLTPLRRELLVAGKYLAGLATAMFLFVGSTALSFLLIGRHFGAGYTDYILHGPGLSQLGSYMLVAALACIGYGAVFLMSGIFFRNPMIPAAVVMVWENLNPFLPTVLKKISVIFYLKNLCPVEIPIPPPFNVMVIDADPTPFWIAVPGLLALSLILLIVLRPLRAPHRNQLRGVAGDGATESPVLTCPQGTSGRKTRKAGSSVCVNTRAAAPAWRGLPLSPHSCSAR